jgi:hypothetical protein
MEKIHWTEAILKVWADEEGNPLLHHENKITVYDILNALGLGDSPDMKRNAQININQYMGKLCRQGYVVGGVYRNPRLYVNAGHPDSSDYNPVEALAIGMESLRNNQGRITRTIQRGIEFDDRLKKKAIGYRNEAQRQLEFVRE